MKRLISALVIVAILLVAVFSLSTNLLLLLVALIISLSNWEFFRLRSSYLVSTCMTLVLLALMILIYLTSLNIILGLALITWTLLGVFVLTFPHSKELVQNVVFSSTVGLIIHLSFWYSIYYLLTSPIFIQSYQLNGRHLLILVISISAITDTAAYFGGRRFGKRKFLPNVSPNKTLEGFLIAMIITPLSLSVLSAFYLDAPFLGLYFLFFITSLYSVLGDAVASLFKRIAGVKDTSNLIPGHGGMLDRIDSHLAAAPIFVILLWVLNI
jgi:phosphatidate cytidylyltransferase